MVITKPKISQAIILAAGFGTRMQPLTFKTPKPLVKIDNKPIIYYILEELKNNNIKKLVHVNESIKNDDKFIDYSS